MSTGTSAGQAPAEPGRHRHVPPAVCANCPICQTAAALDSLNPALFADLAAITQNVLAGIGAAMAAAAEHRTGGAAAGSSPRRPDPDASQADPDASQADPDDDLEAPDGASGAPQDQG